MDTVEKSFETKLIKNNIFDEETKKHLVKQENLKPHCSYTDYLINILLR